MTTTAFPNVTLTTAANVYFDGKCVSHSFTLADGTKKSVGVVLPSTLTFNTGAPEIMETVAGRCSIKLKGETDAEVDDAAEQQQAPVGALAVGRDGLDGLTEAGRQHCAQRSHG